MPKLSLCTPSVSHLMSMSAPIGSTAIALDPASDFPTESAVGATHPVEYFSVTLSDPALVVLRMQEANTASRCALFLSCTSAKPDVNSASWRLISPEPVKQVVLHPADPAYRVGVLTIAVQYLEASGQSSFQLRAEVRRDFFAMWLHTAELPSRYEAAAAGEVNGAFGSGAASCTSTNAHAGTEGYGASTRTKSYLPAMSTLHAALTNSGYGSGTATTTATAGAAAPAPSSSRGALFTSLYIGDWNGNRREGLGFQYYAAPSHPTQNDVWAATVQTGEGEEEALLGSGNEADPCPHHNSSATTTPRVSAVTAMTPPHSTADALLLLRAFSERHNLPWSAWSIPDTLTPEELVKLGFGYSNRSAATTTTTSAAATKTAMRKADKAPASGPAPIPTFVRPPSPHTFSSSPTGSPRAVTAPPLPPSAPAAPRATAVEGMSVLGSVIDRLLLAEIRDAELGQWAVLPVQPGVEVYAGEWAANRKDGRGFYQWLDRSYVGEWVAGRREGFGLLRRRDGGWYRGQWERHVPHGVGEARLMPEDLLYKGEWRHGRRNGHGCLTYPDSTAVHGVWKDDVLQPEVHAVYADGSTYDGTWGPDACREGSGTLTDTAGCRHIHVWSHNVRTGPGREVYANGVALEGVWEDDVLTDGVYVFPNGDRYVGEMDATLHVRDGTGTCTSADGLSVYTGGWSHDQRCGHGVLVRYEAKTANSGSGGNSAAVVAERYDGEWRDDLRCGTGKQEAGDEVYEGSFERGCRDGTGVLRNTRTGSFYEGHWKADHRCGAGAYYSATKDTTYEGVFLHDRLTGAGTSTRGATAERYSGLWLDGVEQGHGSLRLANGDTLRGVWHRGLPEPDTSVEYIDAPEKGAARDSRYVGGWRDGARHGAGTQVYRDGSVYEGAWEKNRQHGHGRRTAASGESVECEWENGGIAPGCVAAVLFADGSAYAGQVNAAGVPHGVGVLTYPDGTVFDGHFEDGIYQL